MKKINLKSLMIIVTLLSQQMNASVWESTMQGHAKGKKFKRLFSYSKVHKSNNYKSKSDDISITFEDFTNHFDIGKNRIVMIATNSISMDIGSINSGFKETWVVPNLPELSGFKSISVEQINPEGINIYESFGYGSHILYSKDFEIYELYNIDDFDFNFIGYSEIEDGNLIEYEYEQAKAPIPIEMGLEYQSTVSFESNEIEIDSIQYKDIYNVIGQGILKTLSDGDVDGMKMIYKEETREFKDGIEMFYEERSEIVFYSKEGHYLTASIENPWNNEGVVTLNNLMFQKLDSKTASVQDIKFSDVKTFPNPIAAGQTLNIKSEVSLSSYAIAVYNVNGQKISNLNFSERKNNEYQVKIPQTISSGFYFYKIHNNTGIVVKNGKIQVK